MPTRKSLTGCWPVRATESAGARHWMDIWRYSDWYGFGSQIRNSQPHIWHWRDWIIESLNQDKGYDRMVLEMLAGDELAPTRPEHSSRHRLPGPHLVSLQSQRLDAGYGRTCAAGFLGITLKCARCHDHKYDPIAQEEYYRFRAFFEPYDVRLERVPGEPDREQARHSPHLRRRAQRGHQQGSLTSRPSTPKPTVSSVVT